MVKRLNVASHYIYDAITVRTQIVVPMAERKAYESALQEAYREVFGSQTTTEIWTEENSRLMQSYNKVIPKEFQPMQCFPSHNTIENTLRKNRPQPRRKRAPKKLRSSQIGTDDLSAEEWWDCLRQLPRKSCWECILDRGPKSTSEITNRAGSAYCLPSIHSEDASSNPEYETLFNESMETRSSTGPQQT